MNKKRVFPKKGEIVMLVHENGKYKTIFKVVSGRLKEELYRDRRRKYKSKSLYNIKCLYTTHKSKLNRQFDPDEEYTEDVFLDKEFCKKRFYDFWWEYPTGRLLERAIIEQL